tara:strand:+ start:24 stop:158 length:135 start_codon:yes stop_codon:yes gene_type:complete
MGDIERFPEEYPRLDGHAEHVEADPWVASPVKGLVSNTRTLFRI